MAYDPINVLVGAATIYIDDNCLGWTTGGLAIEHSSEFYDVEVDQDQFPVKTFRFKEGFMVKTNLTENTLENLKIAWGISSSIDGTTTVGYRRLVMGANQSSPVEHTLAIYGHAPSNPGGDRQRKYYFYRVASVDYGSQTIEKNKEQLIPVVFKVLYDKDTDSVGYVEDQTVRTYKNLTCRVTVA